QQDAVEHAEVVGAGRQHERYDVSGAHAMVLERAGRFARAPPEICVADAFVLLIAQGDLDELRLALDMPRKQPVEREYACRRGCAGFGGGELARSRGRRNVRRRCSERGGDVAQRLGRRKQEFGKPHAQLALDAREQLDARETVQPEVVVQFAVEGDFALRRLLPQVLERGVSQSDQPLRRIGGAGGLRRPVVCLWLQLESWSAVTTASA